MSGEWLELSVAVAPETVESVTELMSRYVSGGVAIEEPYQLLDDGQAHIPIPGAPVVVRCYVPADASGEEARARIEEGLWHLRQIIGDLGEIGADRDEDARRGGLGQRLEGALSGHASGQARGHQADVARVCAAGR